jgi:hypothetical protein
VIVAAPTLQQGPQAFPVGRQAVPFFCIQSKNYVINPPFLKVAASAAKRRQELPGVRFLEDDFARLGFLFLKKKDFPHGKVGFSLLAIKRPPAIFLD